MSSERIGPGIT